MSNNTTNIVLMYMYNGSALDNNRATNNKIVSMNKGKKYSIK